MSLMTLGDFDCGKPDEYLLDVSGAFGEARMSILTVGVSIGDFMGQA
jgi:hypothetical protein